MKNIYAIAGLIVVFALLFYFGKSVANRDNHSTTSIIYSTDNARCKLNAAYPIEVSDSVIIYINKWASYATQRSGELPDTLRLKFPNGLSCRLHAKRNNLEIIADRANNNNTALAIFKDECNIIKNFILAKSNKSR